MWEGIRIWAALSHPHGLPLFVWFATDLSLHGGRALILWGCRGIYNPLLCLLSLFRVCCMCLCSFVRLRQMTRFCVSTYWTLIDTHRHSSTLIEHTLSTIYWEHLEHTLSFSCWTYIELAFCYLFGGFLSVTYKKLSASSPLSKRLPSFSLFI